MMPIFFNAGQCPQFVRAGAVVFWVCSLAAAAESTVEFNRDIRPLLSDRCFACHGPDANHREADLRLDDETSAKASVIVAGDLDNSELWRRITSEDPDQRMPPPDSGKQLTAEDIDQLRRWLEEGAIWEGHWAFEPIRRRALPKVDDDDWGRNPIDRFVLDRLKRSGLDPSPRAARETLIRRLSFDLTGLPPSLDEIDRFIDDRSPNAWEIAVDRLLASPHYGERLAMDWLDGARFADTNGYQNDFGRDMSPWRDWVIQAFNENMPFDQFILEQIAGDLLPNASVSQRVATGFNRNHRSVTEGGSIEEEWHVENVVDRVETVSATFLGLTMGCARCHDHKYDPISQKEFYRFFAFFNNVDEKGVYIETRGNVPPMIEVPTRAYTQRERELQTAVDHEEAELEADKRTLDERLTVWRDALHDPALMATRAAIQIPLSHDLIVERADGTRETLTATSPASLTWNSGLLGPALNLDGANDVGLSLPNAADWDSDQAFSLSVWLRDGTTGALISKVNDRESFRGWDAILREDGQLQVRLVHHWPDDAITVTTQSPIATGAWTPLTIAYDGSRKASGVTVFVAGTAVPLTTEQDQLQGSIRTSEPLRIGQRPSAPLLTGSLRNLRFDPQLLAADQIRARIAADLWAAYRHFPTDATSTLDDWRHYFTAFHLQVALPAQEGLNQAREALEAHRRSIPTVMILNERTERRPTYRLQRGQYDLPDQREVLTPDVPAFLPALPDDAPRNRLGLARWLVDDNHPLVARVVVNRLWQRFFGQGLLRSSENFGAQADAPSHPQLLDWLASELLRTRWDLKQIQKLIVTSATYQQASSISEELAARDPDNRLLARGPRFRMPAEMIRDNALATSGLLERQMGGPSVKPYQPAGMWLELAGGASQGPYVPDQGSNLYRRSLYTYRKRTVPHATTNTFDAPSWEICQVKRSRTNTPLQALALLNDTTYVEASRKLGERMLQAAVRDDDQRLKYGFRLATGRNPDGEELRMVRAALAKYLSIYGQDAVATDELLAHGDAPPDATLDKTRLAAFTTVASILLNLDETITKE